MHPLRSRAIPPACLRYPWRHRLPIIACALWLGGLSLSATTSAQSAPVAPPKLEQLQGCLDRLGYGQREWSAEELNQNTAGCISEIFVPPNCPTPRFSRGLSVDFEVGEPHPTWSANERARIADQLPRWIDDEMRQHPRIHGSAHSQFSQPLSLEIKVRYEGSGWSQRDLDDWVRQPRSLMLELRLRDTMSGAIKDARELKLSFPPRLRSRDAGTSGARWLGQLEQGLRTASKEMFDTLSCEPDVLTVQPATREGLSVSFGNLKLRSGQSEFTVVLLPADGQRPAALWPQARVRAIGGSEGRLTLPDDEEEALCERQSCIAIPL